MGEERESDGWGRGEWWVRKERVMGEERVSDG